MKKVFLICASTLLMVSCVHTSSNESLDNTTTGETSTASSMTDLSKFSDEDVVKSAQDSLTAIYSKVFAWYNDPANAGAKTPDFEALYMSDGYNKLYKEVVAIDDKHPDMVGFFDSDHWVCGQDYQNLSMKIIGSNREDDDEVNTEIVVNNCGSSTRLAVDMIFEQGKWKIDDFKTADANGHLIESEKTAMKNYITSSHTDK